MGATPATNAPDLTEADHAKAALLDQVLVSKNDNDPRLDTELKQLSPGTKKLFQDRYRNLAPEKRNEKGTVVFLLGRNLENEGDLAFMGEVISEAPCLSLGDCANEPKGSVGSDDLHHDPGSGVTLAYPQIVALKSIEAFLSRPERDAGATAAAWRSVEAAQRSRVEKVAELANEIARAHGR